MLLFAAGLLIASFLKLQQLNPGFHYNQLATFETTLSVDRYGSPASLQRFLQEALPRIQKLPGVESAASVSSLPTEPTLDFLLRSRAARSLRTDSLPGTATT